MKKLLLLALVLAPFSATHAAAKKDAGARGTYKVDTKESKITWEGRKLGGAHQGTLKVKSGSLQIENGILSDGEIVIDMTSLKNDDQQGEFNTKLVNHLKSDDFFSVEKNPTSRLKVKNTELKDGKTIVNADLTIKGITKPISFPADVKVDGKKVTAKGEMVVDRTMYDIKFRSLKFFANIGDKVIKDDFTVGFDLSAGK